LDNRYKLKESNSEVGNDASVGEMVGVAVPVPDVVDGGGGVYPQSPQSGRFLFLLDLRGGAQLQPHGKFQL
jgi:hypothetical protein